MAKVTTPLVLPKAEPAKFGLINSKTLITETSEGHWTGGFSIDEIGSRVAITNIEICDPSNASDVVEPQPNKNPDYLPFVVEAAYDCSTFGFGGNEYWEKAIDALRVAQGKAIEHEFWTGALNDESTSEIENMRLSSISAAVVGSSGSPVSPSHGLAILEQALADCGYGERGFVHATRGAASAMTELDNKSEVLKSNLGTYIIAGTGYTGTGPGGIQPSGTQSWMYATGPVSVLLGDRDVVPDTLNEAVNTRTNHIDVKAQRPAAVVWEGTCHFAVLVDLALEY